MGAPGRGSGYLGGGKGPRIGVRHRHGVAVPATRRAPLSGVGRHHITPVPETGPKPPCP